MSDPKKPHPNPQARWDEEARSASRSNEGDRAAAGKVPPLTPHALKQCHDTGDYLRGRIGTENVADRCEVDGSLVITGSKGLQIQSFRGGK